MKALIPVINDELTADVCHKLWDTGIEIFEAAPSHKAGKRLSKAVGLVGMVHFGAANTLRLTEVPRQLQEPLQTILQAAGVEYHFPDAA